MTQCPPRIVMNIKGSRALLLDAFSGSVTRETCHALHFEGASGTLVEGPGLTSP